MGEDLPGSPPLAERAQPEVGDGAEVPADSPAPARRATRRPLDFEDKPSSVKGVKWVLSRLWAGGTPAVPKEIADIVRSVRARHPKTDTRGIVRAYQLASFVHEGQMRKSGERFIEHPTGVARILAELGMDATTIIAAFLHDAIEDTELELTDIKTHFGEEVVGIIDGLTKIERIGFRSKEHEQAENLRKMIVAMAKDARVLIIKLADRLHNMRTIDALEAAKRELVAKETLEIYAPLAHRLGIQQIRSELEDLGFKTLQPKVFAEVEQLVAQRQPEREKYLEDVVRQVQKRLREIKVKADISGRPKHYYSVYDKMVGRGHEFNEIFDLVGMRIIVEEVRDCYAALGAVHSLWKPVPGRFKDYIAQPKFNLYQSLHTSVVGPGGKPLEIQIRTEEMHRIAEMGVAAHWVYKEDPKSREEHAAWMRRMLDLHETEDSHEFLEALRLDLFADEVFVFTPKGEVIELTSGATPVDFAYAIHTEVGHACAGARVDGRLVPLSHHLSSGESVEIITTKTNPGPSRDWLKFVVTPRARTKIKQWFTKERREEALTEGREALVKGMRRAALPVQKIQSAGTLDEIAEEMKFPNLEALWLALGEGRLSVTSVVGQLTRLYGEPVPEKEVVPTRVQPRPSPSQGVVVEGVGEVWVKLSKCCLPVPGDPIIGFVTRGRGVSVHRQDCPNAKILSAEGERLLEVAWDLRASGTFAVAIQVEALDRPKLLRDVTTAVSDLGINITSATSTVRDGLANLSYTFEVADPAQLAKILTTVRKVESVYDAYRVSPARR